MFKKIIKYIEKSIYKLTKNNEALHRLRLIEMESRGVIFGDNFRCFSDINRSEPYLIDIGNNVTISTNVKFITHDNSVVKICNNGTDVFGKIKISDSCFIGSGTIILPGVTLGNNIIVGAGSIVTKSFLEEGICIAGNPAKKICSIEELKVKNKHLVHDMRGLNSLERKNYLLKLSDDKFIKR